MTAKRDRIICGALVLLCLLIASSCAKDDQSLETINFSSNLQSHDSVNGWWFSGPPIDPAKAFGKHNNQIYRIFAVPENAKRVKVKIKFFTDTLASMNLTDVVWSKNKVEIERSVKEIRGIPEKELVFDFEESRPSGADELWLCVRPWRDQDGVIKVMGGQLEWLK